MVVGPPPSGDDWADVDKCTTWVSAAWTYASASSVGERFADAETETVVVLVDPQLVRRAAASASSPKGRLRRFLRGGAGFARASAKPGWIERVTEEGPNGCRPKRRLRRFLRGGAGFARASAKAGWIERVAEGGPSGCSRSRLRRFLRGCAGFARASAKPAWIERVTEGGPSGCSRSRNQRRLLARLRLPRPGRSDRIRTTPRRSGC
jgi:hypothetical protein